jgi:myo-inositol-1(or 4)-monophosphatase
MIQPTLAIAIKAARRGADVLQRSLANVDRVPVKEKERHDYVSEVDQFAEQEIVKEIHRAFPNDAILGEEGGSSGSGNTVWIIDPLDGTQNYLRGIPHYCVSIAQQVDGKLEHAVVYDPFREELFTASRGRGAMLNNTKIRVSRKIELQGSLLATAMPFRSRQYTGSYLKMKKAMFDEVDDLRTMGSAALDLAYVAAGRLDGYWEFALHPWDIAAGALLVREAGGVITDFSGGDNYLESGNVIAAPFKLITPMRKVIQKYWMMDLGSE